MRTTRNRGLTAVAAGGFALALTLAACTPPPEDSPAGPGDDGDRDLAEGCEAFEQYGDLSGTSVSVYTSITAPEDQPHIDSYTEFERCTGADIVYDGSREFEAQLPVRVQAGNPPDIAYIPQPGLLQTIVRDFPDAVVPVGDLAESNVDEYYDPSWKEYGTVDGTYYATPLGANVKSFVWYSPDAFADAGYEIPETWDELLALSDQIVDDGGTPWCVGIESGDATGWPATDWLEDVMLRTAGPEVYDQWVDHEIPFNDPAVAEALAAVGEILKNEDYVNAGFGDVRSIASTPFTDAGFPILDGECWMHRQASFYAANWESADPDVQVGENGDVFAFYLPGATTDESPLLGGGEFVAAFDERPEVQAFQAFLTSPEWVNAKIPEHPDGGWVSANRGQDMELYASPIDRLSAELLADDDAVFRFDASDLMPGEVGSNSFWTEMVNWIANDKPDQDVLDDIEASWP
ncbi:ABC transporter substrate-binding protein [Cellulomonas bogoriensis]|uniref:Sugar ABC transporter substrate-binding protein n=1 Tax=Cellulomonas bogoriensis 69B4 = DSM 16987 TaxID=1386082 RepID=A0A0A0C0L2_9CELL|nr:ABC transporter substrate-binding protein [Cellulomonas bogoriensis]KGM12964.1 sugar ABC transporter substrate-binding protein [Cellulomonas bogoriensis 69B4 = DSM 16987]